MARAAAHSIAAAFFFYGDAAHPDATAGFELPIHPLPGRNFGIAPSLPVFPDGRQYEDSLPKPF